MPWLLVSAADHTTASEWAGGLVLLSVLTFLVGFLVKRSRARSRVSDAAFQQVVARLPEEYRPRRLRHRTLWLLLYIFNSGAVGLLRGMTSDEAALVYAIATFTPFTVLLLRQANTRHRQIKESVRARRAQMDYHQMDDLVSTLEEVYGPTMKQLRTLLPPGPSR